MSWYTWRQLDTLDTLTYETKAMLEVMSDGLLNETCPSRSEDCATMLRMAVDKIEMMGSIHEEMWADFRDSRRLDEADNEDADDEENSDTESVFPESDEEEDSIERPAPRFNVEEIKAHEDGSATYQVSGSDEEMKRLFEVFFTSALINGIKYTKAENDGEIHRMHAIRVARELEVLLREWETSDDFDYDPVVKGKRLKLKELLDKAGA